MTARVLPSTRRTLHTTSEASTSTSPRRDVVFICDGWRVVVLIRNGCCRRTRSTSTRRTNRTHQLQNIRRQPLLRRCGRNCRRNIRRTGLRAQRKKKKTGVSISGQDSGLNVANSGVTNIGEDAVLAAEQCGESWTEQRSSALSVSLSEEPTTSNPALFSAIPVTWT